MPYSIVMTRWLMLALLSTGVALPEQQPETMSVLEKRMLVQHFFQHYEMLSNSRLVWRKIVDWTDAEHLPEYCRRGVVM